MKATISDLRKQVDFLKLDQNVFPILYQLLSYMTCPDIVLMDKITPTNSLYIVSASDRHTSGAAFKKNYHKLKRLYHLDRQPAADRNIAQQLVAIHNILAEPITLKKYDCYGIRAVMGKGSSRFCRLRNPTFFRTNPWLIFGINAHNLSFASSTMRENDFLVASNIATEDLLLLIY